VNIEKELEKLAQELGWRQVPTIATSTTKEA